MQNDLNEERRGFRLPGIAGTSIDVDPSFLILGGLFIALAIDNGQPFERALLCLPVLFVGVLLHELGHAAVIGLFGFGPSEISLTGAGGVTRNRRAARPWQDVMIALAGPVTSCLIGLTFLQIARGSASSLGGSGLGAFIDLMATYNLIWAVFNILPIFPLDGGLVIYHLARNFVAERRAAYVSIILSLVVGAGVLYLGLSQRQFFLVILVAMMIFQNIQRWQFYRSVENQPTAGQDH